MAEQTPKHRLTRVKRGWMKRVNGKPKWIVSNKLAPTTDAADDYYEKNFTALWQPPPTVAPDPGDAVTVGYLADAFLDRKERSGIDPRTVAEYDAAARDFAAAVGVNKSVEHLTPADFAKVRLGWDKRFGPYRLRKFVKMIRTMFRWGQLPPLRLRAPDYGDEFEPPGRADFRRHEKAHRDKHGAKLFTAADVAKLLKAATPNLRAMILLALNGGFGNTDVAALPLSVLDLDSGFLDYARGKTGIDRRVPLWPQTVKALRVVLADRAAKLKRFKLAGRRFTPAAEGLVFVTLLGRPYIVGKPGGRTADMIGATFGEMCAELGLAREGRNFYSLRRVHRTFADEVGDQRAAERIMGHSARDQGATYVLRIDDARLVRVVNHVRKQLKIR